MVLFNTVTPNKSFSIVFLFDFVSSEIFSNDTDYLCVGRSISV